MGDRFTWIPLYNEEIFSIFLRVDDKKMIGVFKDELEKESFGVFLYSVYKFRYRGRLLEEKIYDQQKILAEPQRTDANAEEYDFALSLLEQFRDKKAAK